MHPLHKHLKRLPPEHYRGRAYVHWSLTIEDRKTGWLIPTFFYKYREILTHTAFRFGLCCPIYCCMPDHIHLLWVGILDSCDQLLAMRYLRKQLNPILEKLNARFQEEPYDHVLQDDERQEPPSKPSQNTSPETRNAATLYHRMASLNTNSPGASCPAIRN